MSDDVTSPLGARLQGEIDRLSSAAGDLPRAQRRCHVI
jgi:hypothetical protein